MSERTQICEKIVRYDGREGLCLRAMGHRGACICFRKHAAEAEAFARGVEAMREASVLVASSLKKPADIAEAIRALSPEDAAHE